MFNQKLKPKVSKYLFSPIVISIVISICLLANLSIPRFSTVGNGKCSTASSRYHMCGCRTEAHSIDLCCCKDNTNTSEKSKLPNKSMEDTFAAFIQSLACAGIPDQYTAITYEISLPDVGVIFAGIYRFNYLEWPLEVIPSSIAIPPLDKPPRII